MKSSEPEYLAVMIPAFAPGGSLITESLVPETVIGAKLPYFESYQLFTEVVVVGLAAGATAVGAFALVFPVFAAVFVVPGAFVVALEAEVFDDDPELLATMMIISTTTMIAPMSLPRCFFFVGEAAPTDSS